MEKKERNPWYRFVYGVLCQPVCRFFNIHVDNAGIRDLTEPFIAISNHPSFFDWAFAARSLAPHSAAFIVNRLYFRGPLGFLLRKIHAVPRSLMTNDLASVRQMLRLAREGENMCMFPDPCISLTGDTEGQIADGTYKLLKRLGMTVVGLRHEGSFHSKTPWGKGFRRGRVDSRAFVLFTPEELKTLPDAEGEARLRALVEDRILEPRERGVAYKSRHMAEGLEKLFFLCPHCGKTGQIESRADRVFCRCCGESAVLNEYYELVWDSGKGPESLSAWYAIQREKIPYHLAAENFSLESDSVFHRFTDETGFKPVGPGRLRLDREGLHFLGEDGTEQFYPTENIHPLFQKLGSGRVYLFVGTECHEFELLNKRLPVNFWRLASEYLHELHKAEIH